jgi:hypothetical protein
MHRLVFQFKLLFFLIVVWRFKGSISTVWDCPLYSRGVGEGTRRRVVVMRLLWNWLWFHAGLGRTWAQGDAALTYPDISHMCVLCFLVTCQPL